MCVMKNYLLRIGKYLLLLFSLFVLERTAFLLSYHKAAAASPWNEILSTYYHGIHLDISTAAYFFIIPFIILTLQLIFNKKWLEKILSGYTIAAIVFIVLSAIGDIFLYEEWSTKLNYKVWYYLRKPAECFRTATWFQLIIGTFATLLLSSGLIWIYLKWISKPAINAIEKFYWQTSLIFACGVFIIFVGMRGRLTDIPISQSCAYFSKDQILNDAAVNTQWHLVKSTIRFRSSNKTNQYVSMDQKTAEKMVAEMFVNEKDTCIQVLNQSRPNIVIIILESWSADLVESLGGKAGITPYFHQLEKEGLLFTQTYATGRRSQEGISGIVSGFPSIPVNTITDNFEKYHALPSISQKLKSEGYNSSFYFGGNLDYGNLRAYLMAMQFGRIIDEAGFPKSTPRGKLSIHDEYVLTRHLTDLHNEKSPFLSVLFTGSTHSPYDMPTTAGTLNWNVDQLPYLNSAKYADWALGKYFEKAKKEGWYDNTLFVLVADHSHETYKGWKYHEAGYQHIPMLWLGGALKDEWRGKQWDKLCSYIDLPPTLLNQLQIKNSDFRWSHDIFNPYTPQFVAFQNILGIAWLTPQGSLSLDFGQDKIYCGSMPNEDIQAEELKKARAYLQVLYQSYLDL